MSGFIMLPVAAIPANMRDLVLQWAGLPLGTDPFTPPAYPVESYPLNAPQAHDVVAGVDEKTAEVLRQLVESYDPAKFAEDSAWIECPDAWRIAGVKDHAGFSRAVLSGLHRRLRSITGHAGKLVLLYEESDYCSYYIDSEPAVLALREAFKL
jgi:hypothetical protein